MTPGRIVGVDLGERRIGIAVSDSSRTQAFARTIVQRSGDETRDRQALVNAIKDAEATVVVVGLPISLDGSMGPAAKKALLEVVWMTAALDCPVETFDERLTSVEATRRISSRPVGRSRRSASTTRRRVDDLAAEIMLQAYLDRKANG